jgi:hypothetical protein
MNREALDDDLLDIPFPRSDERLSRTDALFSTPWDDLELVTGSAGQQNEARPHWDQFLGSEHYIYEDSEFSSIVPSLVPSLGSSLDPLWLDVDQAQSFGSAWNNPVSSLRNDGLYINSSVPEYGQGSLYSYDVTSTSPSSYNEGPWTALSSATSRLLSVSASTGYSHSETSDLPEVGSERGVNVFRCSACEATFSGRYGKGNLARHRRHQHIGHEPGYPCEETGCARTFKRKDARLKHYRRHHPQSGQIPGTRRGSRASIFTSESCRSETATTVKPASHSQDDLSSDEPFPMTRENSSSRAAIPRSVPLEFPDLPLEEGCLKIEDGPLVADQAPSSSHRCTQCGAECQTSGRLKNHINRSHVRRYKCEQCDKAFNLRADLNRHQLSKHKPELQQIFHCSAAGCTHTFNRRDNLVRHVHKYHEKPTTSKDAAEV